jgi:hypothetical protein
MQAIRNLITLLEDVLEKAEDKQWEDAAFEFEATDIVKKVARIQAQLKKKADY